MSRGRALALAGALLGSSGGACFSPPADDVLFACDPANAPACPQGYRCEADGCCHRVGSDIEAKWGACALGVETSGGSSGSSESSGSGGSGESTGDSGTETTGESTGSGSESGTSGTG